MNVSDANLAAHRALDARFWRFLEHVTALELDAAHAALDSFAEGLHAHMRVEEEQLMTRLATAEDGPRQHELVLADHKILTRQLAFCRAALGSLNTEGPAPRRQMVQSLSRMLRVHSVLEHHAAREERDVYPLLERILRGQDTAALATALRRSVPDDDAPSGHPR